MTAIRARSIETTTVTTADQAELDRMAARLHHEGWDLRCLRLSRVRDDFTRQAILNELSRQHGKGMGR